MILFPGPPAGVSNNVVTSEYWTVNITLKDSAGTAIDLSSDMTGDGPMTISFGVGGGFGLGYNVVSPTAPDQNGSGTLGVVVRSALLSAIKSWAQSQDWNTGITWSDYGVTNTPVAFDSVQILDTPAINTNVTTTDITP